jgi:Ca-activated chloride channel family protein
VIELADPWLLALLPLPLLARLLPPTGAGGTALRVPANVARRLTRGPADAPPSRRVPLLPALAWVLVVVALAGPRQLVPTPALPISGRDLVLALDLSGSMVREDFALDGRTMTRLEAVQRVGADFVRGRGGDRVSLVVFGSEAYYAVPATFDVEAVAEAIEAAVIGISGRATNISDALGLALKRLAGSEARSKVVILLSDGKNNAGAATPGDVADLARDLGVRVHTIAMAPFSLEEGPDDPNGAVDATTLRRIAEISGGEAFRVRTTEDLVAVTVAIDRLEATDADGLAAEVHRDLWVWPASLAGAICLALCWPSVRPAPRSARGRAAEAPA